MELLQFKKVTKDIEKMPFDCGMDSINEYVKESYFSTVVQHAYAYSIEAHGIILGYYQIMFREIELDDFPDEVSEYDPGIKDNKLSALHIRFIAIDKKYQKNKIGTGTLRAIIGQVQELSDRWPIRVITIDARTDLINWYIEEGFVRMRKNTYGQDGVTEAMYFDCLKAPEELADYLDSSF